MMKSAVSPFALSILTLFFCLSAMPEVYGNSIRAQKNKATISNLIYYSKVVATVGGVPSNSQGNDSAEPEFSQAELGEMLIEALQAGRSGQVAKVRNLLRMGANPEYKSHKKALSPLDIVIRSGELTIAKVFRQHGVKFTRRGSRGITFLHQAAADGNMHMVQFLISLGISPNAQTTKGWTPLHHAARFGHPRIVLYLIRAGADPTLRNSDGYTPKELAKNARYGHVVRLFY